MIEVANPTTPEEKDKAVAEAIRAIEKEHGKGSVISMSDRKGIAIPAIPSGIYSLDYDVLGVGGFPKGRIIEVYGPESSGKTTIALTVVASAQRLGGRAAFIDVEHALDPNWATLLGVDVDNLLVSQPDYGEQALDIVDTLVGSGAFDIIVVDSVAALVPKAELDGEMGDSHMGLHARLMSQSMRKLTGKVAKTGTVLIFINQIREKIGVMFGSPETTTGGRALKFYSSVRLDVRRIGHVKDGDEIIGNKTKLKCAKNKVAAPFRETEIDLLYGQGFSATGSLLDAAVEAKVVEKSGSWYSYKGDRLGQGRPAAIKFMEEHYLSEEILKEVRERANSSA